MKPYTRINRNLFYNGRLIFVGDIGKLTINDCLNGLNIEPPSIPLSLQKHMGQLKGHAMLELKYYKIEP